MLSTTVVFEATIVVVDGSYRISSEIGLDHNPTMFIDGDGEGRRIVGKVGTRREGVALRPLSAWISE
ncbi:hypothetical protein MUK42_28601 [Musa troglodytarum]|uniref:Uncharacterized protein n=1 Tax=Musa troglodytarum TaxID=320322 RepID=A0A9E7FP20_9LILI|nr:hypothetical protein MUK42_28601 [Musa troglodytarum]